MSAILKGILEPKIKGVLAGFGTAEYDGPDKPISAQDKFASDLAQAIAQGVQEYINANVLTIVASGPMPHTHKMQAP